MGKPKACGLRLSADQLARIKAGGERRAEPARADVVIGGERLTRSQRGRLETAAGLATGGLEERRKAAAMVRTVEAELREAREITAVTAGLSETLGALRARGVEVVEEEVTEGVWRRDEAGAMVRVKGQPVLDARSVRRMRRADGLLSLHRSGALSDEDLERADRYRALYASAQPPVGTSGLDAQLGGIVDREAPMVAAITRGKAAVLLGEIRKAVGARAADVLEAVAGRGESLRSLVGGGNRWQANRDVLASSLTAADLLILGEKKEVAQRER